MKSLLFTLFILLNCFCPVIAQHKYESAIPERTYLHTDRNVYLAGDYLYYSMYLQGNPGQISKYAYLILRGRNNLTLSRIRLEVRNQASFGSIFLSDTLHSDIYQLVCYTNCMRNGTEDSYFYKEILIANRFDKDLALFDTKIINNSSVTSHFINSGNLANHENLIINLDKQVFSPREKINFSFETSSIPDYFAARLSVAVSEIVPGIPGEPSVSDYFSIMSSKGDSGELMQNQCDFYPEVNTSVIQGRLISLQQSANQLSAGNQIMNNDIKYQTIFLSTPDSIANIQYTSTDSSGLFSFLLNPYYEGKEIIIRLTENVNAIIEPDNKFTLNQKFIPSARFIVPGIREYILRSLQISEIQDFYDIRAARNIERVFSVTSIVPRIYYKPSSVIIPDDFLDLPDFVEISRELLPSFKIRKINNRFILSITDTRDKGLFKTEPIIFLDGVPVDNINQIIDFGTRRLKRIELLPVNRYYGDLSFSGILAVFSRNLEINDIQFKTPSIRYQALPSQIYTKPEQYFPTSDNIHIPDLRQVLLWDPEMVLRNKEKKQVVFYTSDLPGKYLISIQGITSAGLLVSGSAIITVKNK